MKPEDSTKKEGKVVQFRLVNNQQNDGSLSINYSIEDSEELNQYETKL